MKKTLPETPAPPAFASKLLFLLLIFGFSQTATTAQPQRRGNIWYFGWNNGLDFSYGRPVKIANARVNSIEGITTLCNEQGEVLFYSNGGGTAGFMYNDIELGRIWNRNRDIMYDLGITSGGGLSAAQGAMALPSPANPQQYYLFTIGQYSSLLLPPGRDLSYFVIDMNANGGVGEVIGDEVSVFAPAVECLTAARHSNGRDYWILTIDFDSNDLLAVPVTEQGVLAPVRHTRQVNHFPVILKTSPDSRFLFDGQVLYRFDAATSAITPAAILPGVYNYSFSFSPESRYLYTVSNAVPHFLTRYDVLAADIAGSLDTIAELGDALIRQMQIGPDGNLYFPEYLFSNLFVDVSIIHCPDSPEPGVERGAFSFPITSSWERFDALNNLADFWFDDLQLMLETDTSAQLLCPGVPLPLEPEGIGTVYEWSTGDTTRSIVVEEAGEYRVSVSNGCFHGVETFLVHSGATPSAHIAHAQVTEFCAALPLTMTAVSDDADRFQWSTGDTTASITISQGGDFRVTATNACGEATAEVSWPIVHCCRIYAPNVFSPNLDGINDVFRLESFRCPITSFRLQVFSRWGGLVFETTDPEQGWDGRSGNQFLPSGLYVWLATYQLATDPPRQVRQERGGVSLMR